MGRFGSGGRVEGDLCTQSVFVGGAPFPAGADTATRDLFLLKPTGTAAILINGHARDIVTRGGGVLMRGPTASISGTIDTSGTDPRLDSCAQAIADAAAASALLAGLPPTRDLGSIRLRNEHMVVAADPGVNVWTAAEIVIRAPGPDGITNGLHVSFAPDTDAVIINVARLKVNGIGSGIYATGSGDETRLIVNLPGPGPTAIVKGYGRVEGFLLAPERKVHETADMFQIFAGQLHVRGGDVTPIACP
jgi:hypothetical protein